MITLTDGNKTIELTKREMELIEDGLRESHYKWTCLNLQNYEESIADVILTKLEGLNYE